MGLIILVIVFVIILMLPTVRCAVLHPVSVLRYGVIDLRNYIFHRVVVDKEVSTNH